MSTFSTRVRKPIICSNRPTAVHQSLHQPVRRSLLFSTGPPTGRTAVRLVRRSGGPSVDGSTSARRRLVTYVCSVSTQTHIVQVGSGSLAAAAAAAAGCRQLVQRSLVRGRRTRRPGTGRLDVLPPMFREFIRPDASIIHLFVHPYIRFSSICRSVVGEVYPRAQPAGRPAVIRLGALLFRFNLPVVSCRRASRHQVQRPTSARSAAAGAAGVYTRPCLRIPYGKFASSSAAFVGSILRRSNLVM